MRALYLLAPVALFACHPSRPVTYTANAVYSATCSAVAGTAMLGTKPTKLTIAVEVELPATSGGEAGRTVTPIAGKADGSASAHTARIEMEIDPATVHCEPKPTPRFWLNSDTGELTNTPP